MDLNFLHVQTDAGDNQVKVDLTSALHFVHREATTEKELVPPPPPPPR